ncbi:MAG: M28 family peptidase [Clostridia bacterium]|nr:M28 family peptidase [Clostridia bacterium]
MNLLKKSFLIMAFLLLAANSFCNEIEENLSKHLSVLTSEEMNGRKAGTKFAKKTADYIYAHFEHLELNPQREVFSNGKYQNVIGTVPSKNGKYIIIGAHYDGVGPSFGKFRPAADDNASGTATLLELARILSKEDLEYGIKFIAFDGEESGLYGSNYNSKKIDKKNNEYVLMISIDMVGHLGDEGRLIYSGAASFKNGEELIKASKVDNVGLRVYPVWPYAGLATDTVGYDSKGIPTLNIDTGEGTSLFHSADDSMESLDISGMSLITQQIALFIKNIQGKIEPTGVSIYKETEIRYGMKVYNTSLGLFAMIPIGSNLLGDFYISINPGISRNLKTEKETLKTLNVNLSLPFILNQKLGGVEFICGLGPYYTAFFQDAKKCINQEIGIELDYEIKANCGMKVVDCMSLGFSVYLPILEINKLDISPKNRVFGTSLFMGVYF